ncbi:MAG TPA: DNA polymerase IV [Myxococcales bacterium]|nr:DNA polymerase IV [Myxococcales bacterium]
MRQIIHIDMDAFFASIEQRDAPELRGKPVLVGGGERRGVVAAASYEARPFGVHSAMPMAQAMRRCPQAIVVPPRRRAYEEASAQIFTVFRRFTPLVEGLSVDEAFLDVTGSRSLFGDGATIAARIRKEILAETDLTASAGVAPNKFVAKIASDQDKPDGLTVVRDGEVFAFLEPLPIERMWGVGPKAAERLRHLGYDTLGDLARADEATLERHLGSWGREVKRLAQGLDDREVEPDREAKSVGAEETYDEDLTSRAEIEKTLLRHASRIARRLLEGGISAGRVTVKIKYADFTLKTRQLRLSEPVDDAGSLYAAARSLLDRFPLAGRAVRLTGVSAGDLREGPPPRTLFSDEGKDKRRAVESAMAKLRARFGEDVSLTRADLLDAPGRTDPGIPRRMKPPED